MTARGLVFTGPREISVRERPVAEPGAGEVVVRTGLSAISPGTELLLYRGEMPEGLPADVSIDALEGDLSYPTRYGYAAVGEVTETGPDVAGDWRGREVFAFHPHQSRFVAPTDALVEVPARMDVPTAAMIPTAETATNLVLDGEPRVGERVVVFGAGVIGLCTARLLAEFPLDRLVVVEPIEYRRELARSFGADEAVAPEAFRAGEPADLVFELSGCPEALDDALDAVGYDGRVVVGSWYGSKRYPLDLGGRFHRDRIDLVSSQVSTISPGLRGRWSKGRRRETAMGFLRDLDVESLVTDRFPIEEAETAYRQLDRSPDATLQVFLTYD